MSQELLKKISAKDVLGNVTDIVRGMVIGETIDAYAVAGKCEGYEKGLSTFGEWIRFIGDFSVINYVTGESLRGAGCHVPNLLEGIIMNGVAEKAEVVASKCTKTSQYFKLGDAIEFAYKVGLTRLVDDVQTGGISYKYKVMPLTELATNDSIAHLTKLLPPPKQKVVAEVVEVTDIDTVAVPEEKPAKAKK